MSSLTEAFTINSPENTNKKPIIQENNRTVPDSMQESRDDTTTTFHQPRNTRMRNTR